MSLHHTWNNNGLENKPDNNQQQLSPNQGNNFSAALQQYQQNVAPQQYQQQPLAQQYSQQQNLMQQPPQSVAPQQYSQSQQQTASAPPQYQQNVAPQQYQQQPSAQQYSQSQQQTASAPPQYQQNVAPQQYQQQPSAQQYSQAQQSGQNTAPQQYPQQQHQQYQQPIMNQQRANFAPTGQQNSQGINPTPNVQQSAAAPTQNQTLAERIANLQSGGLNKNENYYGQKNIKPSDLLNVPIDPNIKVGLGKNMNIAASLPTDLFEDENGKGSRKKNRKLNTNIENDGTQFQCKNCTKKSRPWLTVFVSVLIMLAILGGCVGAIYGFRTEIKDWLLGTNLTVSKSAGALMSDNKSISPTTYYLNS
ncbi:hypothetical protein [Spiroplasma poulsonii]|uniref:hypothetical protein n=1 Tax=Spiroplasma poulsonii TaxID=2138 RepID=UPI0018F4F0B9|nr:hypothetical protein [Spiroplasma poulsonii]